MNSRSVIVFVPTFGKTEIVMEILDTIAAISTPYGKGGVAVLRVSGAQAVNIASRVFRPKNGRTLDAALARMATYGTILAPEAVRLTKEYKNPVSGTGGGNYADFNQRKQM